MLSIYGLKSRSLCRTRVLTEKATVTIIQYNNKGNPLIFFVNDRRVASTPGATVDLDALNIPHGEPSEKRGLKVVGLLSNTDNSDQSLNMMYVRLDVV